MQLHAGFTFDDAARAVPYLARLGVSHLYCSPVLQAVPGSTHGYDVVDHSRLSDDLGGPSAYARLTRTLADQDLSLVLDIVPNHMALAGAANRWWWDVLEDGPASRFARHFDIDWSPTPRRIRSIGADAHPGGPVRPGAGGRRAGASPRRGAFTVRYHEHELPLSPRSVRDLVRAAADRARSPELAAIADGLEGLPPATATDAIEERHRGKEALRQELRALAASQPVVAEALDDELRAVQGDPDALDDLLARQSYRLAHWRTASEELDYRRFFDITTLVGLRAEDDAVFQDTHGLLAELVAAGDVAGLRVDHVDGLRDPHGYLKRLAAAAPAAWVAVEKILAADEALPSSWPVIGTSGYDFLARVGEALVDPSGEEVLQRGWAERTDDPRTFAEVAHDAKHHVMGHELATEVERITDLLARVCQDRRRHRDHTRRDLREAVREMAANMDVYRTYVAPGRSTTAEDRARLTSAVAAAGARRPDLDAELLHLLQRILLLDEAGEVETELALRFQQLSAPVMAKGVEDTTFYRYGPLLARNEVGADPDVGARGAGQLHDHNAATAQRWPGTMLALSTHDTKRSADVRARLSVLSELPDEWLAEVDRWMTHNEPHRRHGWPDRATELMLYQALVGAWPIDEERAVAAAVKAANEAKAHTSWHDPDPAYQDALVAFVGAVLGDEAFVAQLEAFLAEHAVVELGRITSLAQTALLLTSPGVPDIYQGDELWDLSLVDPDNRRPVDFDHRADLLARLADAEPEVALADPDGGAKLWLILRLLQHRRQRPGWYEATDYVALPAHGAKGEHVIAFARDGLVTVVPRLPRQLQQGWAGTTVTLPEGSWVDVLTGAAGWEGAVDLTQLLARFPVAVLERAEA